MKPHEETAEEIDKQHEKLLKFVKEQPERASYVLALLIETHDRLKGVLK